MPAANSGASSPLSVAAIAGGRMGDVRMMIGTGFTDRLGS